MLLLTDYEAFALIEMGATTIDRPLPPMRIGSVRQVECNGFYGLPFAVAVVDIHTHGDRTCYVLRLVRS